MRRAAATALLPGRLENLDSMEDQINLEVSLHPSAQWQRSPPQHTWRALQIAHRSGRPWARRQLREKLV